ncbi:hypothetical protein, variant 13 [Aphanomyces astaci]|uniref:Uncharacterized protein n=1 Tax=Aphanomyces astaci TaxID=112090 RepID=W4GXL5_APHAT|nr:hypothetical protein, variant 11 [Aphanomyces astaci]XP_009825739.1 hypothetical protein, variant 14 [Aphanomyces astaci]XP_009825740.1 hypothetical protein, variant 15 [Aphanomyces astaci]XP_009825741.1 hypothetical protein, variant 16 [Aphanomyces astaci]XP_009825742.1 hypothetical protein, variant 17 [Aphanomyces astaci]XP_009825743.1 hypothetical protein, variant 18 [Aphanomyces astaci]XP_009825753.1 hypothetical protein, variant 10 [Aphanomyces astaci]XP_009825754.1 hypothetical prot|eukprot:XP_009825737.1 hypothetical protein, variant 11 [Aphanomyces astaci]
MTHSWRVAMYTRNSSLSGWVLQLRSRQRPPRRVPMVPATTMMAPNTMAADFSSNNPMPMSSDGPNAPRPEMLNTYAALPMATSINNGLFKISQISTCNDTRGVTRSDLVSLSEDGPATAGVEEVSRGSMKDSVE